MKLSPTDYGFLAGVLTISAVNSLVQDYHGKEGYIKWISEHWWSAYYSIPLAILFIIFSWILMGIGEHKELPVAIELPKSKPTKEDCLYCDGHGKVKNIDNEEMLCIACDGEKKVDTWN
jgi:hypothetical protein